jgi:hypothetical protein
MTVNAKNGAVKKDDTPKNLAGLIWQIADLLRGPYKEAQYGSVILPFTVLRRLDCVLEPPSTLLCIAQPLILDDTIGRRLVVQDLFLEQLRL